MCKAAVCLLLCAFRDWRSPLNMFMSLLALKTVVHLKFSERNLHPTFKKTWAHILLVLMIRTQTLIAAVESSFKPFVFMFAFNLWFLNQSLAAHLHNSVSQHLTASYLPQETRWPCAETYVFLKFFRHCHGIQCHDGAAVIAGSVCGMGRDAQPCIRMSKRGKHFDKWCDLMSVLGLTN